MLEHHVVRPTIHIVQLIFDGLNELARAVFLRVATWSSAGGVLVKQRYCEPLTLELSSSSRRSIRSRSQYSGAPRSRARGDAQPIVRSAGLPAQSSLGYRPRGWSTSICFERAELQWPVRSSVASSFKRGTSGALACICHPGRM
jgi:hypothetical protein